MMMMREKEGETEWGGARREEKPPPPSPPPPPPLPAWAASSSADVTFLRTWTSEDGLWDWARENRGRAKSEHREGGQAIIKTNGQSLWTTYRRGGGGRGRHQRHQWTWEIKGAGLRGRARMSEREREEVKTSQRSLLCDRNAMEEKSNAPPLFISGVTNLNM